jgi:uncharacterized protein YjbI with pentapeptide repeats
LRWDNGQLIPGTQGITPGPSAQLDHRGLEFAALQQQNLTGANFEASNLTNAALNYSTLTNANLFGVNLNGAGLHAATLTNANLTGAVVTGASFPDTTSRGFTKEQLYSTASYQQKNLQVIGLEGNNLSGWDFSGQNLTGANLGQNLTGANLSDSNLTDADLVRVNLTGANLTRANLTNANLNISTLTSANLTGANLANLDLRHNNFTDANLTEANLTNAIFAGGLDAANLTNANLTRALVTGAQFNGPLNGFTASQLYSTASYQAKDLRGIGLAGNDLTGWNFAGQNLTNAYFYYSTLTNANLTDADTRGARDLDPTGAVSNNAILPDGTVNGLSLVTGETLVAYPGVAIPVKFAGGFSIAPTAVIDLTDNAAIIDHSIASPVLTVREKILSGRGGAGLGGKWTGTGITSSTAATANQTAPDSRSLGYAENAALPLGAYTTFHGAAVDSTSILIAFTRTGDANLDGLVNDDDVTIVGAAYAPGVPQPSWALGDFDYNGFVDDDDVTLLGAFYDPEAPALSGPPAEPGASVSSGLAAVPEPSTLVLLMMMVAGMGLAWAMKNRLEPRRLGPCRILRPRLRHAGRSGCARSVELQWPPEQKTEQES